MNKGLEALNNLLDLLVLNYTKMSVASKEYNDMKVEEYLNIVVKELKDKEKTDKALEIIKKYVGVRESYDEFFPYEIVDKQYVSSGSSLVISKKVYDLLKEVGL